MATPARPDGRCVLWLRERLRLADNSAFVEAAALQPTELFVVYVWRHGHGEAPTAASLFEAASTAALDQKLRTLNSQLSIIVAPSGSLEAATAVVGAAASHLNATDVIVDGGDEKAAELVAVHVELDELVRVLLHRRHVADHVASHRGRCFRPKT